MKSSCLVFLQMPAFWTCCPLCSAAGDGGLRLHFPVSTSFFLKLLDYPFVEVWLENQKSNPPGGKSLTNYNKFIKKIKEKNILLFLLSLPLNILPPDI